VAENKRRHGEYGPHEQVWTPCWDQFGANFMRNAEGHWMFAALFALVPLPTPRPLFTSCDGYGLASSTEEAQGVLMAQSTKLPCPHCGSDAAGFTVLHWYEHPSGGSLRCSMQCGVCGDAIIAAFLDIHG
jgi:hypothetical protein